MPSHPNVTPLPASDFLRTPWKNGGGVTLDIAARYLPGAEPGGWDGLAWRFGRTRIEVPAPFSDLPGIDRILMPIGSGLLLHVRDGATIDARTPLRPVAFPGERPVTSELTEGPVEVLNLMAARGAGTIAQHVLGETATTLPPGDAVLYAFGGAAEVEIGGRPATLPAGDAVRLACAGAVAVRRVSGGPVALVSVGAG